MAFEPEKFSALSRNRPQGPVVQGLVSTNQALGFATEFRLFVMLAF